MSCYAQVKLGGEAYWWWTDNHRLCRCWFILHDFLRTRYAPHLHVSEADCEEPNVEHKPELEGPQFNDLVAECKILAVMRKILESMTAKVVVDPEPPVFVETKVVKESKP